LGIGSLFVTLALIAVVLLYSSPGGNAVATQEPIQAIEPESQVKMVEVLVPVQRIENGTPLDPAMFRREQRPQIAVGNSRVVKDNEEVIGHYARTVILPGQPLQAELITSVRPNNPLTPSIPEGYRAVTISVDARSSVEGFALPGARVDVVWASRIRDKPAVTVIVQNAKVLSAERNMNAETAATGVVPSTVTLLVTADDAAKIQLAQTTGSLSLSLRGDNEAPKGDAARSITIDELLNGPGGKPAAGPKGPIVTIRGPNGPEKFRYEDGKLVPAE
jgi:pilus assembly protein CpaB